MVEKQRKHYVRLNMKIKHEIVQYKMANSKRSAEFIAEYFSGKHKKERKKERKKKFT